MCCLLVGVGFVSSSDDGEAFVYGFVGVIGVLADRGMVFWMNG